MFIYMLIAVLALYMHVPSAFYLFLTATFLGDMLVRAESGKRKRGDGKDETSGK